MAGLPLSEYIRRRKKSLADVDFQGKGMKIIDVAGRYGYNSPTAFNRHSSPSMGLPRPP